nr:hypothetical protein Itr_chr09CG09540 [Ipomoea trifida]
MQSSKTDVWLVMNSDLHLRTHETLHNKSFLRNRCSLRRRLLKHPLSSIPLPPKGSSAHLYHEKQKSINDTLQWCQRSMHNVREITTHVSHFRCHGFKLVGHTK